MPQELHVLRCYSCKMYQVQIVKKTNKWQCKICNEKQSIQAVFFQGSGSECRSFVQAQNAQNEQVENSLKNTNTGIVETWGLDCDADEHSEICNCAEKRFMVETLTRCFQDSKKKLGNENFSLSQNPEKRRKIGDNDNRAFSLPSSLTVNHDQQDRESTFKQERIGFGKWEKFLDRTVTKNPENSLANEENTNNISEEENSKTIAKEPARISRVKNQDHQSQTSTFKHEQKSFGKWGKYLDCTVKKNQENSSENEEDVDNSEEESIKTMVKESPKMFRVQSKCEDINELKISQELSQASIFQELTDESADFNYELDF